MEGDGGSVIVTVTGGTVVLCDYDSCIGCTGTTACNYDETSTQDDGSCTYSSDEFDCDGNCISGSNVTLTLSALTETVVDL